MTAKEYLMQARKLNASINAKLERIMQLRALAEKRTGHYGEHTKGGTTDRYDIVTRIIDREHELDREIDDLLLLQSEIERVIASVKDETQRTILELRYLNYLTWEQISERIHYDRKWLWSLHERALEGIHVEGNQQNRKEQHNADEKKYVIAATGHTKLH